MDKNKKVLIIWPPLDSFYSNVPRLKNFENVPTWLSKLTFPLRNISGVKIIGSPYSNINEIINQIKFENPTHVGISTIYSNMINADKIAKEIKTDDTKVILGGPGISNLGRRIIDHCDYIDFVVEGPGEEALKQIILEDYYNIPNTYSKLNSKLFRKIPLLNSIYDLDDIVDQSFIENDNPLVLSLSYGCEKAFKNKACYECSIGEKSIRLMNPNKAWELIQLWNEKYKKKRFIEGGDSLSLGNYFKILLEKRPYDLKDIVFDRINLHPNNVNKETLNILKKLNVQTIFLGIESYNNHILKNANRNYDIKIIDRSISLVNKYGFNLHFGIIYGIKGETKETAINTYNFVERTLHKYQNVILLSSLLKPFPNSQAFQELLNNENVIQEYGKEIFNNHLLDYDKLTKLHIKYFTNIDFHFLEEINKKTINLGDRGRVTTFY
jgi:radical SAM superfamily enzyme YgiQ (UPF0313 family)